MTNRSALLLLICAVLACAPRTTLHSNAPLSYPLTRTVEQIDRYHGVEVADPYRWLENDVRSSRELRAWVDAQNAVTFAYLDKIEARQRIRERLTRLWDFERFGLPVKKGGRYFYEYNDGLLDQDIVYMQSSRKAEPVLLLDPNAWSADGTLALAAFYPSPDGRYLAYLIQDGGSDWREARILDIQRNEVLPERLKWLKFTRLSWAPDSRGFFYGRYPAPAEGEQFQSLNKNQSIYFHDLGTNQDRDRLVYATPAHPERGHFPNVTEDGRWLVITSWLGTGDKYEIAAQRLDETKASPRVLIPGFEHDFTLVDSLGDELLFRTNESAVRNRLIAVDTRAPHPARWREIIPQSEDVLDAVNLVGEQIVATYIADAKSVVRVFDLRGENSRLLEMPGVGTARGFDGRRGDPETFFEFTSIDRPATIFRLDLASGRRDVFRQPLMDFDSDDFVVRQVFYESADGTRVPMFIAHHVEVQRTGRNPTLLYGYGGFNVPQLPRFSITRLAWMEMGGVYAVANLRGGGEYGKEWHEAGQQKRKQNVFDDFIAAAQYLIDANYTQPDKLAIMGGSNGGLLVGAVINQRPDLFAAALPAVGVMDMLRFHLFTAGRFWVDEYGSPDDPEDFRVLYGYSPYHNIRQGTDYPATLITTADTDDRVVPGHSFKYAAALQAAQAGDAPILIRIETRAGHGAGTPTSKIIEEYADRWAFLVENLDMDLPTDFGARAPGNQISSSRRTSKARNSIAP